VINTNFNSDLFFYSVSGQHVILHRCKYRKINIFDFEVFGQIMMKSLDFL